MKFEIDLNNRPQLESLERELMRYLDLVRFALKKHGEMPDPAFKISLGGDQEIQTASQSDLKIGEMVTLQKHRFNSSAVYEAGKVAGIDRATIKSSISRMIEDKKIRVVEKGKGRRPTTYEKI